MAVANPSSTTSFTLEEVKMLALPDKQSAQLVDVETGQVTTTNSPAEEADNGSLAHVFKQSGGNKTG